MTKRRRKFHRRQPTGEFAGDLLFAFASLLGRLWDRLRRKPRK